MHVLFTMYYIVYFIFVLRKEIHIPYVAKRSQIAFTLSIKYTAVLICVHDIILVRYLYKTEKNINIVLK